MINLKMITWTVLILSSFSVGLCIVYYRLSRKSLYAAAAKIRGPPTRSWPLIGDALNFICKAENILHKAETVFKSVGDEPVKFWLGPYLLIGLKNPKFLEKVMSTTRFSYKHELYIFLEMFLGQGLISTAGLGPNHKTHRRIIQPMLDIRFGESCLRNMQKHLDVCIGKLREYVGKDSFDINDILELCTMDMSSDIILGKNMRTQNFGISAFAKASRDMYLLGFRRMMKIWLHPDFIYNWLPDKRRMDQIKEIMQLFVEEAVVESWQRRRILIEDTESFVPLIDRLSEYRQQNPNLMNNQDCFDHLKTLYTADTFATIASFAVVCFGMYPEYQMKAVHEIKDIIGTKQRQPSVLELNKLVYLEMCLKDVLRLFPVAAYILRRTIEDFQLDKWTIPKGAALVVPIYNLHRDKKYWKNPQHFHPDHFLPDAVSSRHIYTYLPFSAGPRGCIAKTISMLGLKLILVNILMHFEIEADGKVPDLELCSDITVRPKNGHRCRIRVRNWE